MRTLIHRSCIPKNVSPRELQKAAPINTMNGTYVANSVVTLRKIRLPEFNNNARIDKIKALVHDTKTRYDIILGGDFMGKAGIDISYSTGTIQFNGTEISLRDPFDMNNKEFLAMADAMEVQKEDAFFGDDWLDAYMAQPILDAKYEKVDIPDVVAKQTHLNDTQRVALEKY